MDAWNAAKLILDISFGVIVTLTIVTFIYFRERRLRTLIASYVATQAGHEAAVEAQDITSPATAPEQVLLGEPHSRVTPSQSAELPSRPLVARYQTGNPPSSGTAPRSHKPAGMSRTEKYLEAVRMYRDGRRREDIESSLGISFMELELLGQLK